MQASCSCPRHLHAHTDALRRQPAELDTYILLDIEPYRWAYGLLQTIFGIDQIMSALIPIETDVDMAYFGSA